MNYNKNLLSAFLLVNCASINAGMAPVAKPAEKIAPVKSSTTEAISMDALLSSSQVTVDLKVRYVNTMDAMQMSARGKEVQKELEVKRDELTNKVKNEESRIQQAVAMFKSKESTLNKNARNEEEAKIVKMQREYEMLLKTCEDDLKLAMQQATEALSVELEKTITTLAQNNKYDVVQDVYTGRTVYASERAMITNDLIQSMDKQFVASNKKAPAKTAAATA
ncbi:MAG TPA: OmpH family outer membrane protein [Candidatus Babeliales bacterium]|nr:OmpH family outer membrane protein [Candidatus Babeliales bacterium]